LHRNIWIDANALELLAVRKTISHSADADVHAVSQIGAIRTPRTALRCFSDDGGPARVLERHDEILACRAAEAIDEKEQSSGVGVLRGLLGFAWSRRRDLLPCPPLPIHQARDELPRRHAAAVQSHIHDQRWRRSKSTHQFFNRATPADAFVAAGAPRGV